MVFSELIIKLPYSIIWYIVTFFRKDKIVAFYAENELDFECFKNDYKHLKNIKIIAKNNKVKNDLLKHNIKADTYPSFPNVIIMARHSIHKFPAKNIIKIGIKHGIYHFKTFISAKKFNRFDLYFMTSEYENNEAKAIGITNSISGSFPKLDELFDDKIIKTYENAKKKYQKKILLFTATWDKSGLSAVEKWYDKLEILTKEYEIFVTLHPWIDEKYKSKIKSNNKIKLIEDYNVNKYLYLADVLIGDTSSIIGEYFALNKPIISFNIQAKGRLKENIINMLDDISYRINDFDEINPTLTNIWKEGNKKLVNYSKYQEILFDLPLGNAGEKRAKLIEEFINSKTKRQKN